MELVQRNFFMLSRLKYLDLSGNPLQDLQPDVFRDVPVSCLQIQMFKSFVMAAKLDDLFCRRNSKCSSVAIAS